jgi:hypothetical protein
MAAFFGQFSVIGRVVSTTPDLRSQNGISAAILFASNWFVVYGQRYRGNTAL